MSLYVAPLISVLVGVSALIACADRSTPSAAPPASRGSQSTSSSAIEGQSGSEAAEQPGANTVPCPCGWPWPDVTAARVVLVSREAAVLRLRIEEILDNGQNAAEAGISVGAEMEATSDGVLPCYRGSFDIANGQEAQAVFRVAPVLCSQYAECRASCHDAEDGPSDAGSDRPGEASNLPDPEPCQELCDVQTEGQCPDPGTQLSVRLTAWEDQLLFAATEQAELRVPAEQLSSLWQDNIAECVATYGDWASLPGSFIGGNIP